MQLRWLIPFGAAAALPAYHAAYAVQYMSVEQALRAAFAQAEGFVDVPLNLSEAQRRALDQGEAAVSISAPCVSRYSSTSSAMILPSLSSASA
jgi:hypothetical protein